MSTDFALHIDPDGDVLRAARECEAEVFLDRYGNTAGQWDEEYGPYEASSTFLAIIRTDGTALAALRVIRPTVVGLKSLADVARPPWHVDGARAARAAGIAVEHTWDVATIAVRRGAGHGGLLAAALYHALFRAARANGVRWIVMILDARAHRLLDMADIRTTRLPGTRAGEYLGSAASTPLWGELAGMADHQRRVNPDAHRLINLGIGLDAIAMPSPERFVLVPRQNELPPATRSDGLVVSA